MEHEISLNEIRNVKHELVERVLIQSCAWHGQVFITWNEADNLFEMVAIVFVESCQMFEDVINGMMPQGWNGNEWIPMVSGYSWVPFDPKVPGVREYKVRVA